MLAAIARLTKTQRETTTLFYINGYSVAEVAGIQEVPVGTVKRRLHDARGRLKEEMLTMVEDVLKSEAPREDFAQRVFEVLDQRRRRQHWHESVALLREIGEQGIEGFYRALQQPHWQTRRFAAQMIGHSLPASEEVIELFKSMREDANKKVRKHAAMGLLNVDVPRERKVNEFLPLLIPLLGDRSAKVRWRTAYELTFWAEHVPLAAAARALTDETNPHTRAMLARLVRDIIGARGEAKE